MASPSTNAFDDVPDDILFHIYNHLGFYDQIRLMEADRRFRRIALEHPFYWQDVWLGTDGRSVPGSAFSLFFTRLAQSGDRPVDVAIDIPNPLDVNCMDSIAEHLPHTRSLRLQADIDYGQHVLTFLRRSAPMMKSLFIRLLPHDSSEARSCVQVDPNILGALAPLLRTASIFNLVLPSQFPPAFCKLEKLDIGSNLDRIRLPFILSHCRLEDLTIQGRVIFDAQEYHTAQAWHRVKILTVNFSLGRYNHPFSAWSHIPLVVLVAPDHTSTVAVLNHIPGQWRVVFLDTDNSDWFKVDITAAGDSANGTPSPAGVRRRLHGYFPEKTPGQARRARESLPALMSSANQIVQLVIPANSWDLLVGYARHLPALTLLQLVLANCKDASALWTASTGMSCPKLQHFKLRARSNICVDMATLVSFAKSTLLDAPFPIILLMTKNLTLSGDPDNEMFIRRGD